MVRRITIIGLVIYCMVISFAFAGTWRDDFEDGDFEGWEVWWGNWKVENGELIFTEGEDICGLYTGEEWWSDYTVQADIMVVKMLTPPIQWPYVGIAARYHLPERPGYYDLIFLWSGGTTKLMVDHVDANWGDNVVTSFPFPVEEGRWYTFKMILEKEHIEAYLDDKLIARFDDKGESSGKVALDVGGIEARFDNIVITGPDIPDGGSWDESKHERPVNLQDKLATIWGSIKRGR